ncbi:hypothetical protein ACQZV8_15440 [Magnetococcales bacterium HHB-1]
MNHWKGLKYLLVLLWVAGCAPMENRLYMVVDPESDLMFGSSIWNSISIDPMLFKNRYLKIRIRNISGDPVFDLHPFEKQITDRYRSAGWMIAEDNRYGFFVDIVITSSGQVRRDSGRSPLMIQGGATLGSLISEKAVEQATGVVAGISLDTLMRRFNPEDTYFVEAHLHLMKIRQPEKREGRSIRFEQSDFGSPEEIEAYQQYRKSRRLEKSARSIIWVYAGGNGVDQKDIAQQVQQRLVRILRDFI